MRIFCPHDKDLKGTSNCYCKCEKHDVTAEKVYVPR